MEEIRTKPSELITPAWHATKVLLGFRPDAGFMIAVEGKVYFLWKNPKMRHNWDILFAANKRDVKAHELPWYAYGAGLRLTIDSEVHGISFLQPL